jgi:hypothetical protein
MYGRKIMLDDSLPYFSVMLPNCSRSDGISPIKGKKNKENIFPIYICSIFLLEKLCLFADKRKKSESSKYLHIQKMI